MDQFISRVDTKEMIGTTQQWKQTFTYDRYGNRRFDTTNNNTTTLQANCQVAVCNPTIDPATNKLIGYTFDASGNTKVDANNRQFIYDAENKQVEVKDANNITISKYFYDGDGKRVKKISATETTIFVYNANGQLVAEYSTQISTNPQVSYLTNDHLGSPRITTDANGQVISRRDFMPFGEEIARASYGTDDVRKHFATYERDAETGLDYAQARTYNKNLGRFNSTDPIQISKEHPATPQRWNLYIYVVNNPLNLTDPDGRKPRRVIDVFITFADKDLSKRDKAALRQLRRSAPKGVKINIYTGGKATVDKFIESLQTKGRTVILAGHSAPSDESLRKGEGNGRNYGDAISFPEGRHLTRQENIEAGIGTDTVDGTFAQAKNVAVFSCNFGPTFDKLKSTNNTNFLYFDNGDQGYSSPTAAVYGAISAAKVFARGGTARQAQKAVQNTLENTGEGQDADGDNVMLRVIKKED
jgi:RHS repeat-associated protein